MPILNYTTKVGVTTTVNQLQKLLAEAGADGVTVQYEGGEPTALVFAVTVRGRPFHYRLPSNWRGVQAALERDGVTRRYQEDAHAKRVAWRIVKDWTEAQLALIDAGLAELGQVFLPYVLSKDGRTLYEIFKEEEMPQLEGPTPSGLRRVPPSPWGDH